MSGTGPGWPSPLAETETRIGPAVIVVAAVGGAITSGHPGGPPVGA
jgi:hypothetical protein